ncbi:hypothetical protein ACJIZ3_021818 [Penstemon smallii]|uniref:BZIP domain-containing protein n=1 Tax=Penstemon smallii TaxID=265156 RepID=A0ABD3SMH7_9LAMI
MSCRKARAAEVVGDDDDDDEMVIFELEAAEALAGLGRSSSSAVDSIGGGKATSYIPTDRDMADQKCCGYASNQVLIHLESEKTVETIPNKFCSTSHQSSYSTSTTKSRKNMNEDEKEARKLRRILANRESARETIRRRQSIYLELTRKAAELTEENENLKKGKELAVEEYNSLKDRNKFLRTWMAKIKKAKSGEMQEEPSSSKANISHSATTNTPFFPSLVPYFWPSVPPSSNVFQFQCPDHNDITTSSQFLAPNRDTPYCSHLNSTPPFYVLPVPWLFPYHPNNTMVHSNYVGTNDDQNEILSSDNNPMSFDLNLRAEDSSSPRTMPQEAWFTFPTEGQHTSSVLVPDVDAVSSHEHIKHGLAQTNHEPNICPLKKPEESFAASEARRRRKELMKLKNTHCHHAPT